MKKYCWSLALALWVCAALGHAEEAARCPLKLWTVQTSGEKQIAVIAQLKKTAKKALREAPHPVVTLGSAGKIDRHDAQLIASRQAFLDADRAAVLGLMFYLTQDPLYLDKTRAILMQWAQVNHPTGNPIDETRLEGMLWAFDFVSCALSKKERATILGWFTQLRNKKQAWAFGPLTALNNHRTHQLKMLLLLDKLLGDTASWKTDLDRSKKFVGLNLNPQTGESLDYKQRNALHYHNYDLQAWLEITLLTGCCQQPVNQAFHFLSERLRNRQIGGEFLHSSAKIDQLRGKAGFDYAKRGGVFDVRKAAPTIVLQYTASAEPPAADLWSLVENAKSSPWLAFLKARRDLWVETHSPTGA